MVLKIFLSSSFEDLFVFPIFLIQKCNENFLTGAVYCQEHAS